MAEKPFFSIVIPTYNRVSNLQFALYCIFRQSFSDFEVIISDNCSTDNTEEIVNKLKDKKIRYFRTKNTVIYPLNIKNALKYAKGKYIFIHSDDDFFLYTNSLQKIYEKIMKYKIGYLHVNYICLAPNKKRLFSFRLNTTFIKDRYLPPFLENKKILSFILNSNHYFITGTIFKNILPSNIKMLNSEHAPWMDILFYVTKRFGAYFVAKSHIVASWSQWRLKHNPVYELADGKLESESYFNVIKSKIDKKEYDLFLHNQFKTMYVQIFPIIKVMVGNKKMLSVASRVRFLDPAMGKSIPYWIYLIIALVFPGSFLKTVKNIFRYMYMRSSKVDNNRRIMNVLRDLELGYLQSRENVMKREDPLFKF